MGRVADRSKATPKRSLAKFAETPRSELDEAIGNIEHQLWLNRYELRLSVEIIVGKETLKAVRRTYEDLGYNVYIEDDYPVHIIHLS